MILCERPKNKVTIFQLLVTDYLQYAERQKLNYYDIGYKIFEIYLPQQLVEMLVLQNKPWIVEYKKNKS